jgi:hypothetical protein
LNQNLDPKNRKIPIFDHFERLQFEISLSVNVENCWRDPQQLVFSLPLKRSHQRFLESLMKILTPKKAKLTIFGHLE